MQRSDFRELRLLLGAYFFVASAASAQTPASSLNPTVEKIDGEISEQRIAATLQKL
jgi:hypothetical protein